MNDHLSRALAPVLADLEATGTTPPAVVPSAWQDWPTAESAYLRSQDGTGVGVWTDTVLSGPQQVVMVAEQVQEWAFEEQSRRGRPTNWPRCEEHPLNHPLEPALHGHAAVWRCPGTQRPASQIGRLSGSRRTAMSVVPVDERDCEWERHLPRFRVYVQRGGYVRPDGVEATGGWTSTYDVIGTDLLQTIDWAQRQADDGATYSIALVVDGVDGRGLVWLVGMDGNDTTDAGSPEEALQARMLVRRGDPVGIPEADRASR